MINYLVGDATNPEEIDGVKLLVHICNNQRAWGAGFVLALSKKWDKPELIYRFHPECKLGQIQMVQVEHDIFVINMIAQELGWKDGQPPIRYQALDTCLWQVSIIAEAMNASVIGPRFGAGLAGGKWGMIEELIIANFDDVKVPIYIFDLPETK